MSVFDHFYFRSTECNPKNDVLFSFKQMESLYIKKKDCDKTALDDEAAVFAAG